MEVKSFYKDLVFDENRVKTAVILETSFSKEIRITMKSGQIMKEHKAPFPIAIHVLKGCIDLGVSGIKHTMTMASIISLESNIPHDLTAKEDSVIRLTLSKKDNVERVESVAGQ